MIDAVAEDVVELRRVRCRAVDERRGVRGRLLAEEQPRFSAAKLLLQGTLQKRRRRDNGARKGRRVPIDDGSLGVMQHLAFQRFLPERDGKVREPLDDVHPSTLAPVAFTSGPTEPMSSASLRLIRR